MLSCLAACLDAITTCVRRAAVRLKAMKPDVEVVGEFFPKFGAPDFSTEI